MMQADKPRGVRNNNPLNIRYNAANDWRGQIGNDGSFVIFDNAVNGFRAAAKLMLNYMDNYGLYSIEQIIARWAPEHENPTQNYARFVAARSGIGATHILNVEQLPKVIEAMSVFENGGEYYDMDTIKQGIAAV